LPSCGLALVVGAIRLWRRFSDPTLRWSAPDDYFSLAAVEVFFFLTFMTLVVGTDGWRLAYFLVTAAFLFYVPFSKISHYVYWFFARVLMGCAMAPGVLPRTGGTDERAERCPEGSPPGTGQAITDDCVASSNLCTHCGWCVDQCHYYLATKDPTISRWPRPNGCGASTSAPRLDEPRFSALDGARELTEAELDEWVEIAYRNCTLCDRCMANCPLAVDTAQILLRPRCAAGAGRRPKCWFNWPTPPGREENLDFSKSSSGAAQGAETEVKDRLAMTSEHPVEVEGPRSVRALSGAHTITRRDGVNAVAIVDDQYVRGGQLCHLPGDIPS